MTWTAWTTTSCSPSTAARPDAFGVFYRRHERMLLGFFMRRTGESEVAADLTAETFAAAVRSQAFAVLDRLRFDPAVKPGWKSSP